MFVPCVLHLCAMLVLFVCIISISFVHFVRNKKGAEARTTLAAHAILQSVPRVGASWRLRAVQAALFLAYGHVVVAPNIG